MGQFAVGQVVPREEDPRLLKGLGRFLDDVVLPQQSYAHVLRSPHAHARIRSIDSAAAAALPGVLAVLTGADYAGDGLGNVPCEVLRPRRDGSAMYHPPYAPLVTDRVRRVGDCVAIVVAETVTRAKDAAELIEVDYEPLPAVSSVAEAVESGAPLVWDDCPGNESWYMELGDRAKTDAVFATADRTMAKRFFISRITANTMEPRGCLGDYDRYDDRFTLYTGLQNPHQVREYLAHEIFRLPETKFRVIAYDIGGSFGMKGGLYPEIPLVLWASKRIGRPVKWVCERSDGLMSDDHARDQRQRCRAGLYRSGQAPRDARPDAGQHGRLSCNPRHDAADKQSRDPCRSLYHRGDPRRGLGCVDQYQLDRALSRRGQTGGCLYHRTDGGVCRR